jgi:protein-S-isoprenylcysteine O-methyltransferase Ste14
MSPLQLWLGLIVAGWLLDVVVPLPFVPPQYAPIALGCLIVMIGCALIGLALHEKRDFNAPDELTGTAIPTLVTGGVYRFTRNPIYLGLAITLLGAAVAANSLWVLAGLIPYFWMVTTRTIPVEEAELARIFGELYQEYAQGVRRWL